MSHAVDIEQAVRVLRSGRGADLLMVDVEVDIRDLVGRLGAEHIRVPIVACGTGSDARAAVAAINAGAKEYIPLPTGPRVDRRGAGGGRRRPPRTGLSRRGDGAGHQARAADRAQRCLGAHYR